MISGSRKPMQESSRYEGVSDGVFNPGDVRGAYVKPPTGADVPVKYDRKCQQVFYSVGEACPCFTCSDSPTLYPSLDPNLESQEDIPDLDIEEITFQRQQKFVSHELHLQSGLKAKVLSYTFEEDSYTVLVEQGAAKRVINTIPLPLWHIADRPCKEASFRCTKSSKERSSEQRTTASLGPPRKRRNVTNQSRPTAQISKSPALAGLRNRLCAERKLMWNQFDLIKTRLLNPDNDIFLLKTGYREQKLSGGRSILRNSLVYMSSCTLRERAENYHRKSCVDNSKRAGSLISINQTPKIKYLQNEANCEYDFVWLPPHESILKAIISTFRYYKKTLSQCSDSINQKRTLGEYFRVDGFIEKSGSTIYLTIGSKTLSLSWRPFLLQLTTDRVMVGYGQDAGQDWEPKCIAPFPDYDLLKFPGAVDRQKDKIKWLSTILLESEDLRKLYIEAVQHIGLSGDKFETALQEHLQQYASDLRFTDSLRAYRLYTTILPGQLNDLAGNVRRGLAESFQKPLVPRTNLENLFDCSYSDLQDEEIEVVHDISNLKSIMLESSAFSSLLSSIRKDIVSDFSSNLEHLASDFEGTLSAEYMRDINTLTFELASADLSRIQDPVKSLFDFTSYRFSTSMVKKYIERVTGDSWDWWPLRPTTNSQKSGYTEVSWTCTCGNERALDAPTPFVASLNQFFRGNTPGLPETEATSPTVNQEANSDTSSVTSPQRTESKAWSSTPSNESDTTLSNDILPNARPNCAQVIGLTTYALLGINKSQSLHLEQIAVRDHTDAEFFESLRESYYRGRGLFRNWLSIWRFTHCEFLKFEKFDEHAIAALDENRSSFDEERYPDRQNDHQYRYVPKPIKSKPPVSKHEFYHRFYACYNKRSLKHFFHRCNKPCKRDGVTDVVNRIPKRTHPIEEESDGRELFWGIRAIEKPAFRVVLAYHIAALIGPFIFQFLWLYYWDHPGDLQNASVPFTGVAVLLSLIWFPLLNR